MVVVRERKKTPKMIVKIKKKRLIRLLIFLIIAIPIVYAATGPVTKQFMVYLRMANQAPYITWVNKTAVMDPVDGNDVIVQLYFNVTDPDGYADIDATTANMTVNESSINITSTSCSSVQNSSTWGIYNCSVTFKYWHNASNGWQINATIVDNSGVRVSNATERFTYNELSAMQLPSTNVNFSEVSIGSVNVSATNNPFIINNTGNDDFDVINMTASHLRGMNTTTETLNVQNISINWTGSEGFALNNSNQTLTGLTLPHGESPISNKSINFYITVPSDSGLTPQNFNATQKWTITVFDAP